jgi:ParB-like nuclease family protein
MSMKPKKLKLKKTFTPPNRDKGDEFFPNGIFEFNITKMIAFINANPAQFSVEEIEVKRYAIWDAKQLNEEAAAKANISNPIILAEISPGRFNVIDGNHRLERARRMGLEKISAYRVSVEHHLGFLTSERAYRAYIEYWNSKVDEWDE